MVLCTRPKECCDPKGIVFTYFWCYWDHLDAFNQQPHIAQKGPYLWVWVPVCWSGYLFSVFWLKSREECQWWVNSCTSIIQSWGPREHVALLRKKPLLFVYYQTSQKGWIEYTPLPGKSWWTLDAWLHKGSWVLQWAEPTEGHHQSWKIIQGWTEDHGHFGAVDQ